MDGRLLVTGCGRSGTGFLARVLTVAGLEARHEGHSPAFKPHQHKWPDPWKGTEVSWLAAAHLDTLPENLPILHQVRNPLAVTRSFLGFGFFTDPEKHQSGVGPYRNFMKHHAPEVALWDEPIDQCLQYWVTWNLKVERHAVLTYRLESLTPAALCGLLARVGVAVPPPRMEAAFRTAGTKTNHRARAKLTAAQILKRPLGPMVAKLAGRYGYRMV